MKTLNTNYNSTGDVTVVVSNIYENEKTIQAELIIIHCQQLNK